MDSGVVVSVMKGIEQRCMRSHISEPVRAAQLAARQAGVQARGLYLPLSVSNESRPWVAMGRGNGERGG